MSELEQGCLKGEYSINVSLLLENDSNELRPQILDEQDVKCFLGVRNSYKSASMITQKNQIMKNQNTSMSQSFSEIYTSSSSPLSRYKSKGNQIMLNVQEELEKLKKRCRRERKDTCCCEIF
ncbi:hypothetical protein SteCoe_13788 [Stentor coeruleus]|uniref:Uncharacterized protein n=1 Tax=Stentor coeruleus TaxID=5963 RepID=A0A1R2C7S0_9CILI|nr:hypothetical protein SteCoe_13788 [Stentor coeruleus]